MMIEEVMKEENKASDINQSEEINNEPDEYINQRIHFLKGIFFSSLIVEFIILTVCLALSITDIVTDVFLSIKYFNGFDHNCLKVNFNLTTVGKSSINRPTHPGWFYLTLFFIVLPCVIRILTIETEDLLHNYFSCFDNRKGFHPKTLGTKILWKVLLVPILPVLVIINQFRQFPLLLKIHQEKERLDGNSRKTVENPKSFKIRVQKLFKSLKEKLTGGNDQKDNELIKYDDERLVVHIENAIKKSYEKPPILLFYDQLIPLTEDKFLEAFMESAPQMILQLKIFFGSKCSWGTIFIVSVISSFFNLAATVTNFSVKLRQKNPALRQASLAGKVFLIISKAPFLLSRMFAISIIFALPKNGTVYGFSYIVFGTIIFAVYEHSQMTSKGIAETIRKANWLRFLVKLFTRGYISNYILLEDRLIKYDGSKWIYQSDEPYNVQSDETQHQHQLIYMVLMSSINFTIGCAVYSYQPSYFNLTPIMHALIALSIMFGGVFSLLFSIVYQSTKHSSIMSQLGAQANCMLHIHLINCYKNDFHSFPSIFQSLRPEDGAHMLYLKEKSTGKTILTYIEEDKERHRTRHVCAVTCCLAYYPEEDRLKNLKNCTNLVCELIKENNLKDLEIALSVLSKHKQVAIPVESSLFENYGKETYMLPLNVMKKICSSHFTDESKSLVHSYMGNMNLKVWKDDLINHDIFKQMVSAINFMIFQLCTLCEIFVCFIKMPSDF